MPTDTAATLQAYRAKLKGTWGISYSVPEQPYHSYDSEMQFNCNLHGYFACTMVEALKSGCPNCIQGLHKGLGRGNSHRVHPDIYLQELTSAYPNLTFPHFKQEYVDSQTLLTAVCLCGNKSRAKSATLKHRKDSYTTGCRVCSDKASGVRRRGNLEKFITKATATHGNRFDYSKVVFTASSEPVEVVCKEHGSFWTIPNNHIRGATCLKCKYEKLSQDSQVPFSEFLHRASLVHDLYEYSEEGYAGTDKKVSIKCPTHGWFKQAGYIHLAGAHCKKCAGIGSKGQEDLLEFIRSIGFDVVSDYRYGPSRKQIDVYIPEIKTGIEFNGLYWHSSKYREDTFHKDKQEECKSAGIDLLHLFSDEWAYKQDTIKSILKIRLGKCPYPQPEFRIEQCSKYQAQRFHSRHNLEVTGVEGISFAAKVDEIVKAVLTLSKNRNGRGLPEGMLEVSAYSACPDIVAFSPLFSAAIQSMQPTTVIGYSNNRLSNGDMFEEANFKVVAKIRPSYTYKTPSKDMRIPKSEFRRWKLKRKFGDKYQPNLTEKENCEISGFYQVFDCGMTKWMWTSKPQ